MVIYVSPGCEAKSQQGYPISFKRRHPQKQTNKQTEFHILDSYIPIGKEEYDKTLFANEAILNKAIDEVVAKQLDIGKSNFQFKISPLDGDHPYIS